MKRNRGEPSVASRHAIRDVDFAVIDVETTGFSPRLRDRIIEIAIVRMNGSGEVLDEWVTLVNPQRDVGPVHVHGISASDVLHAPTFEEVAGDVLSRLAGAVLVAHNVPFDRRFLEHELAQAEVRTPELPFLCTLTLVSRFAPGASRRLQYCCEDLGISLKDAHSALGDAHATSQLLLRCIDLGERAGIETLAQLGCTTRYPAEPWPARSLSGRAQCRAEAAARRVADRSYIAGLIDRVHFTEGTDPDLLPYLDLLDRVLEDRLLTREESDELVATAVDWGLSKSAIHQAHADYVRALVAAAWEDGVITKMERTDIEAVGEMLAVGAELVRELLHRPAPRAAAPSRSEELSGKTVCFTGALSGRVQGQLITREMAQELAANEGLIVAQGVTKKLDILVIADPNSMSGKAKKARALGTRIMAESVFWRAIGVDCD